MVDGLAEGDPCGRASSTAVSWQSWRVAGTGGVGELVTEPEAADRAGVAVSALESVELVPGVDEGADAFRVDLSASGFEVSAHGDRGDVGGVGGEDVVEHVSGVAEVGLVDGISA